MDAVLDRRLPQEELVATRALLQIFYRTKTILFVFLSPAPRSNCG